MDVSECARWPKVISSRGVPGVIAGQKRNVAAMQLVFAMAPLVR